MRSSTPTSASPAKPSIRSWRGDDKLRFQGIPYEVGGDTILAVDGREVVRPDDIAHLIATRRPGAEVTLDILHEDGRRDEVEVTLGERPNG